MISVIVPIYNTSNYLSFCIESVLKQSYVDIEVILINDGSTDNSLQICDSYAKEDNRVVVINKTNEGVDKARFDGLRVAKGEFITFVDSDDWLEKDALEVMHDSMTKYNVDYVEVGMQRVMDKLKLIKRKSISPVLGIINQPKLFEQYYVTFFGYNLISINIWGKLYRRSVIEQAEMKPSGLKMGEDLYFNMVLFPYLKSIYITDYVGYNYRFGGMTTRYNPSLYPNLKYLYCMKKELINQYRYYKANDLVRIEMINVFKSDILQKIMFKYANKDIILSQIKDELDQPFWEDVLNISKKDYIESPFPKAILQKDSFSIYNYCNNIAKKQYLSWLLKKKALKLSNYL